MKIFLLTIILYLSVISCSTESEMDKVNIKNEAKQLVLEPHNTENLFDNKVQEYYEVINSYNEEHGYPADITELIVQIKSVIFTLSETNLSEMKFLELSNSGVVDIIRNPEAQFQQMIDAHSLDPIAKIKLLELSKMTFEADNNNLITFQERIVAYEEAIIDDEKLNTKDKKIILSLSSISRYLFLADLDRKDRDWEKSKTARKGSNLLNVRQVSIVHFIVAVDFLCKQKEL